MQSLDRDEYREDLYFQVQFIKFIGTL
jgi:hypothetical protein